MNNNSQNLSKPIHVETAKQAEIESFIGYEGSYFVQDSHMLSMLVRAMGYAYAFNQMSDYVASEHKTASRLAHPSPGLGQLRDLDVVIKEITPPGNKFSELSIAINGILKVSGRKDKAADVSSQLAIYRVSDPAMTQRHHRLRYYTLRSDSRSFTKVYNDEALDPKTYLKTSPEVIALGTDIEDLGAHDSYIETLLGSEE
jgi:hypothetical protein